MEKRKTEANYYKWEKISPSITRIRTASECCYLVEGTHTAALLDCCMGQGNLADVVKTLTDLPVILLLTHGHVDHIGGAMAFSKRWLSPLDWELAKIHGSFEMRKDHLISRGWPEDKIGDIQPGQVENFLPLEPESVFDLGGVELQALPLPGHTPGSMAILHRQERTVLLGDACNSLTFLFLPGSLTVEEYQKSLQEFQKKYDQLFDRVLFSHFETADKSVIRENIALCGDIMNGNWDGPEFSVAAFPGTAGVYIAKKIIGHPRERIRADGKQGNIVFAADRVNQ